MDKRLINNDIEGCCCKGASWSNSADGVRRKAEGVDFSRHMEIHPTIICRGNYKSVGPKIFH